MIHKSSRIILGFISLTALVSCGSGFAKVDANKVREIVDQYGEAPDFVDNYLSASIWSSSTTGKSTEYKNVLNALKKEYPKVNKTSIPEEDLKDYRMDDDLLDAMIQANYEFYLEGRTITAVCYETENLQVGDQTYVCNITDMMNFSNLGFATDSTTEISVTLGEDKVVHRQLFSYSYSTTFTVTFKLNGAPEDESNGIYVGGYAESIERGGFAIAPPADPVREGFNFKFWGLSDKAEEAYDFSKEVTSSFTLYAIWEKIA